MNDDTQTPTIIRDPKAGRPKDPAKRAALVDAAQHLFMERGFEATSIDAIAQAAGVAKVTVYSHFSGKAELFEAAIRTKCDQMLDIAGIDAGTSGTVESRLLDLAHRFLALVSDPEAVAIHRLVAAEGERSREVAEVFFNSAILNVCGKVADVLALETACGNLAVSDPQEAAGHFLALVKGMPMLRRELHMPPLAPEAFQRHVQSAVDVFIAAYGHR